MPINEKALSRRIKQHIKGRQHNFFAVVQPGFEQTAQQELEDLACGSNFITTEGGVAFSSKIDGCYRCNLGSRTVSRILMRMGRFKADNFDLLARRLSEIPWELYISNGRPIAFSVSAKKSKLFHTGRIADECFQAAEKRLSGYGLQTSRVSLSDRDAQMFLVRMDHDVCHISMDSSGELLYRRGLKRLVTEAPIRETTAALILREAKIERYSRLLDPMCGSGTFSLEAAASASGILPGESRDFSFSRWPVFSDGTFQYIKSELSAELQSKSHDLRVFASDIESSAVSAAEKNIEHAGLNERIHTSVHDFFEGRIDLPEDGKTLIVLNPPYGGRLHIRDIPALYRNIGKTIKENYPECGYAVIVPGLEAEKALGLSHSRKIAFMNGGIRVAVIFSDAPDLD